MTVSTNPVAKRNLALAAIFAAAAALWIIVRDSTFIQTSSQVLAGAAVGYLGFALYDHSRWMGRIVGATNPGPRRPTP